MATSCAYKPGVKNKQGEIVNSRLFDSLLSLFNKDRSEAKKHYFIATHSDFLEEFKDDLSFDSNDEVTLESYLKAVELDKDDARFISYLNKEIKSGDYDVDTAIEMAQSFISGEFSKDYIPSLTWVKDGKVHIEVVKKDNVSENNLREFYKNRNLINRIITALRNAGVKVDFLNDENNAANGRYSTKNAEKTFDGLYSLISIFSGENVGETLSEEAGHFVFAAMQEDPLVSRLYKALTPEVINEIFGNELSELDFNEDQVVEAAGRLIGKALQNSSTNKLSSLLNRIVLNAKKYFAKLTKNQIKQLSVEAEITATQMAENFLSSNFTGSVDTALKQEVILFSKKSTSETKAFAEVKAKLNYYKKQMQSISRECSKHYSKRVNKALSTATSRLNTTEMEIGRKYYATVGIADALGMLINDYERIVSNLDKVDFSSREINYKHIDYIKEARVFLDTSMDLLKYIEGVLAEKEGIVTDPKVRNEVAKLHSELTQLLSLSDYTVNDESGIKKVKSLRQRVQDLEMDTYLLFLEKTHGTPYIIRTQKALIKWKNKIIPTLVKQKGPKGETVWSEKLYDYMKAEYESLLEEESILGFIFDSFANIKDPTMSILNNMVRQANRHANRKTLDYRTNILNLYDRLYEITHGVGVLDSVRNPVDAAKRLYERFDDDSFTGNIIQPVNWGKWEKDLDEFKAKCVEEFKELFKDHPEKINTTYKKSVEWDRFYKKKLMEWHSIHSVDHGKKAKVRFTPALGIEYQDSNGRTIKQVSYQNSAYFKLTKAEQLWIEDYLALKEDIDKQLGKLGHTATHRLPQFRGDMIERAKTAAESYDGLSKTKKVMSSFADYMLEQISITSEDADFGSDAYYSTVEEDFLEDTGGSQYGETLNRLPLYGINKLSKTEYIILDTLGNKALEGSFSSKAEAEKAVKNAIKEGELDSNADIEIKEQHVSDMGNISRDPCYSLILYASMACKHNALKNVAIAADMAKQIYKRRHDAYMEDKTKLGILDKTKNFLFDKLTYNRFSKFVDKAIYNKYNPFHIGKVSVNKIVTQLSLLGSSMMLGGKVGVGIKDFAGKMHGIIREAGLGEFIDKESTLKAVQWYFTHCWNHMYNFADDKAEDEMSAFKLYFNVGDIWDSEAKYVQAQKSRTRKIIEASPWVFMNMSNSATIILYAARAYAMKVRDAKTGKVVSMMDIFQRDTLDKGLSGKRQQYTQKSRALTGLTEQDWVEHKIIDSVNTKLKDFNNLPKEQKDPVALENSFTIEEKEYLDRMFPTKRTNYDVLSNLVEKDLETKEVNILTENSVESMSRFVSVITAGIYNLQDRSAFMDSWLGAASLSMRGWFNGMVSEGALSKMRYRADIQKEFEGFFVSNFTFAVDLVTPQSVNPEATPIGVLMKMVGSSIPLLKYCFDKNAKQEFIDAGYTENQYYNIGRWIRSLGAIAFLHGLTLLTKYLSMSLMAGGDDDDDDDKYEYTKASYILALLHYYLKAIRNEFRGVYNPYLAFTQAYNFSTVNQFTPIVGLIKLGELVGYSFLECAELLNNWMKPNDEVWETEFNKKGKLNSMMLSDDNIWNWLLEKDDEGNVKYRIDYTDEVDYKGDKIPKMMNGVPVKVPIYKSDYQKSNPKRGIKAGDSKFKHKLLNILPFVNQRHVFIDPLAAAENLEVIYRDKK